MSSKKEKLSLRIYQYMQNRYKYYDQIEGTYADDKYDKQVSKDASKYFNLSEDEINGYYYFYIMNNINNPPDKNVSLENKKVKINIGKILKNKARDNPKYIQYIKDNKNKIFTATLVRGHKNIYTFKEDPTWYFYGFDLIEA